ncbi:MAG: hypothetical protein ACXWVH_09460, partial [Caulobacteraceae bacterium]
MRQILCWALSTAVCAFPAAAAPPLEAYGALPAIEQVELSLSGDRLAFVGVAKERRQLVVMTADGTPLIRSDVGGVKLRDLTWAGDDFLLLLPTSTERLINAPGRYELAKAVALDVNAKKLRGLFDNSKVATGMVLGGYGVRQVKGRWAAYLASPPLERDLAGDRVVNTYRPNLFRVDLASGDVSLVAKQGQLDEDWLIGPDGDVIARSEFDEKRGAWKLRGGAFAGPVLMEAQTLLGDVGIEGLGRTPNTVLVTDETGEETVITEVAIDGSKPGEVLFHGEAPDSLIHNPATGLLIGSIAADRKTVTFYDPALQTRARATIKAFPGKRVGVIS